MNWVAVATPTYMLQSHARYLLDWTFCRQRRLYERSEVLLTFDDGPHPDITPAVLDRLRAYGARAVFYVVGNRIPRAPHLLQRIIDEGHILGNHTYTHRLDRDSDLWSYYRDVQKCQRVIKAIVGEEPRYFRAPMGRSSVGALIVPRMLRLRHMLWSADSQDWRLRSDDAAAACGKRLCATVRGGDIVLFHDDNPCVIAVLDIFLPHLVSQGFDLSSAVEGCL